MVGSEDSTNSRMNACLQTQSLHGHRRASTRELDWQPQLAEHRHIYPSVDQLINPAEGLLTHGSWAIHLGQNRSNV